jgi:hypothetical protein
LGKKCGVELHLPLFVEAVHEVDSRVKPLCDDLSESLEEFIAKFMVFFAFDAQAFPIKGNSACGFDSATVEAPLIGWQQPGPTKHFAFAESLNGRSTAAGRMNFDRHFAMADEIELVGFLPLADD